MSDLNDPRHEKNAVAILYISYDGISEPLGQSQVLSYLEKLAVDWRIYLISYEKSSDLANDTQMSLLRDRCSRAGIFWKPLRYHKTPSLLATAFDIVVGCMLGWSIVRKHNVQIVHARSYVAAMIALVLKHTKGVRFLFDMRGFWVDERVDGGLWRANGLAFRLGKKIEEIYLKQADHIISLTYAAVKELKKSPSLIAPHCQISVIPTCVDLQRFSLRDPEMRRSKKFILGYIGSVGTWYSFDHVLTSFNLLLKQKPESTLLIINRNDHQAIRACLQSYGVAPQSVELIQSTHDDMPRHIARMNAGIFFIKPTFSKRASSPTRLAEYLACGVPFLTNGGVGDVETLLSNFKVGVLVPSFESAGLRTAVGQLVSLAEAPAIHSVCRQVAESDFSLVNGAVRYQQAYKRLSSITSVRT